MKRAKKIFIICFIVFSLCGCEQKKSSYLPDADVGILLTTFQTGKTMVRTYSKTGKKLQETKYSYGAVGNCGFTVPQMKNKIAYEIALGDDEEADLGAVLAFDISHGSYKRIDFGRNNITETKVDGRYLYCISNNNRITYFDRYDLKTQKKSSYVWKDGITTNFCVHNDKIYAIDMESCVLYQLDFEKKKISPICNLEKEFGKDFCEGFLVANDDFLYMTSYNHSLISVDLHTKKITTKDFGFASGGELIMKNDILYISSVDPSFGAEKSTLIKYDPKTEKKLAAWHFNYSVRQFDVRNNELFVFGAKPFTLNKFEDKENELVDIYSVALPGEVDNYRYSGFWCLY